MSTYTPVATQTLTASASSVTFSNIPQDYTDLVFVATAVSGDNNEALRFNNDTGSNYSWTRMWGDGTTAYSSRSASDTYIRNTGGILSSQNTVIINIQNYSNATAYKTTLGRGANPSVLTMTTVGLWRNTSPITTITYYVTANSFASGSTFSLYGIQAGTPKAQGGQIITTDGTYWYHAFRSSGTFTPSTAITADILVVGGGGGGGYGAGGGGGAGGYKKTTSISFSESPYAVIVGAGGNAGINSSIASNGNDSSINSYTSVGGGKGGDSNSNTAGNGGSGGGAGMSQGSNYNGGTGTSGYGNAGGNSTANLGGLPASGGGGAGAAGTNASSIKGGNGGAGTNADSTWLSAVNFGVSGYVAGGGGGAIYFGNSSETGSGGSGGGGTGGNTDVNTGVSGTTSTGSGGGGGRANGGSGGSGFVIVRYTV